RPRCPTPSRRRLLALAHVQRRQIAERHARRERMACLVADAILVVGGGVADGIEPLDRVVALMQDLRGAVGQETGGGERARMESQSVERRLGDRPEALIVALALGRTDRPALLAAMKILVDAGRGERIESTHRLVEPVRIDAERASKLGDAGAAADP